MLIAQCVAGKAAGVIHADIGIGVGRNIPSANDAIASVSSVIWSRPAANLFCGRLNPASRQTGQNARKDIRVDMFVAKFITVYAG